MRLNFFINFDYKMSTKILYVCIKYSVCDPIWDVTICCILSCDTSKITVCEVIVIGNQKKRENIEIKVICT